MCALLPQPVSISADDNTVEVMKLFNMNDVLIMDHEGAPVSSHVSIWIGRSEQNLN
jgi:hypothetical protein